MSDRTILAAEAWADAPPNWIMALIQACEQTSQNKVADRLGVAASTVSQLIRNSYPGNMTRMEARVRTVLLEKEICCPALGKISGEACLKWRDRTATLTSASPKIVGMFRSCRSCALTKTQKTSAQKGHRHD